MKINWKVRLKNKSFWLALFGIVNDPTTAGGSDSDQAMGYTEPKE